MKVPGLKGYTNLNIYNRKITRLSIIEKYIAKQFQVSWTSRSYGIMQKILQKLLKAPGKLGSHASLSQYLNGSMSKLRLGKKPTFPKPANQSLTL